MILCVKVEIMLERHDISGLCGMVLRSETACFSGLMARYLASLYHMHSIPCKGCADAIFMPLTQHGKHASSIIARQCALVCRSSWDRVPFIRYEGAV